MNEEEILREKIEKGKKSNKILLIAIVTVVILGGILNFVLISYYRATEAMYVAKPIIYIYPEEEQEVTVYVNNPEKFTTTYPKYENDWKVLAKPNGDLTDLKTGRNLYSLYWEGKDAQRSDMTKGFVIKGEDIAKFLEEKLEILGLNERETEEFIIYWLPKMEHNKYNYVYFHTMDEINKYMELNVEPKPETLIRVFMEFKALDKPIRLEEETLTKVARKGYTVVEWGGTEIK